MRYGFILGFICFLASGILSVVNGITEPKIKLQKEIEENLGLKEVMPQGIIFEPKLEEGKIIYYKVYNDTHKLQGFVLKSEAKGYSSNIETLASLNLNLKIGNVKILSQNETPGLGSKILAETFLSQFKEKDLDSFAKVEAITGATISSSAVTNALKDKLLALKSQLVKEIQNAR